MLASSTDNPPNFSDPMSGRVVLGRYRIICPLGYGGTGVVYLGRTEGAAGFSRPVVIKRLLPNFQGDPDHTQMLVREAHILASLRHTGIVGVVDLGDEDGAYVMVLDYVHGYDLGHWLNFLKLTNRRLPIDAALEISIRALEALHHAHTLKKNDGSPGGVIHRDVSPSNILLDLDGNVRLLDFGIAHMSNDLETGGTNLFKGKFGYSHPSLLALGLPSAVTDTYSAALVLFRMLAGVNPFYADSKKAIIDRVLHMPTPRLREFLPDAPVGLDQILFKALSRELESAYPSAQALAEALRTERTMAPSGAVALVSELAQADFLGPMPTVLNLETLAERDAAWRSFESGDTEGLRSKSRSPDSAGKTVVERRSRELAPNPVVNAPERPPRTPQQVTHSVPPAPSRPSSQYNVRWWMVGLVAALLAVGSAVTLAARTSNEPRYLVVSGEGDRSGLEKLSQQSDALSQTPTSVGTATGAPVVSLDRGPSSDNSTATRQARREPTSQYLTQVFARRQNQIHACFSRANTGQASVKLQLSFDADKSGKVAAVSILPSSVASTQLGKCLLGIARSTSFGPLTHSARFRIPVRASRQ